MRERDTKYFMYGSRLLIYIREVRKMDQQEFCAQNGFNNGALSLWIQNKRGVSEKEKAKLLCCTGMQPGDLFGYDHSGTMLKNELIELDKTKKRLKKSDRE